MAQSFKPKQTQTQSDVHSAYRDYADVFKEEHPAYYEKLERDFHTYGIAI